jgi:hypothetical protein
MVRRVSASASKATGCNLNLRRINKQLSYRLHNFNDD